MRRREIIRPGINNTTAKIVKEIISELEGLDSKAPNFLSRVVDIAVQKIDAGRVRSGLSESTAIVVNELQQYYPSVGLSNTLAAVNRHLTDRAHVRDMGEQSASAKESLSHMRGAKTEPPPTHTDTSRTTPSSTPRSMKDRWAEIETKKKPPPKPGSTYTIEPRRRRDIDD